MLKIISTTSDFKTWTELVAFPPVRQGNLGVCEAYSPLPALVMALGMFPLEGSL